MAIMVNILVATTLAMVLASTAWALPDDEVVVDAIQNERAAELEALLDEVPEDQRLAWIMRPRGPGKRSLLHIAAASTHASPDIVHALVMAAGRKKKRVRRLLQAQDAYGLTPLAIAADAACSTTHAFDRLLAACKPKWIKKMVDRRGRTLLHVASESMTKTNRDYVLTRLHRKQPAMLAAEDKQGRTPLQAATTSEARLVLVGFEREAAAGDL